MWGNKFIKIGSKRQSNGSVLRMLICRIGMPIGIVKHTKKLRSFLQKVETEVEDIKMQQSKENEDGDDEAVVVRVADNNQADEGLCKKQAEHMPA